jgi:hypothetical protein
LFSSKHGAVNEAATHQATTKSIEKMSQAMQKATCSRFISRLRVGFQVQPAAIHTMEVRTFVDVTNVMNHAKFNAYM